MKTTRMVPYDVQEDNKHDNTLKELGCTWATDPDGRTFYQDTKTGEKSWETPLRLEEVNRQPPEEP